MPTYILELSSEWPSGQYFLTPHRGTFDEIRDELSPGMIRCGEQEFADDAAALAYCREILPALSREKRTTVLLDDFHLRNPGFPGGVIGKEATQ